MKAYITCPITNTQDKLSLKPLLEDITRDHGLDCFVTIVGGTPEEIFARDYDHLKTSDILIAEVSEPSHGVGMEIGLSYEMGLKRILLHEKGKIITKFAQAMPGTDIIEYTSEDEIKEKLNKALERINENK